MADSTDQNTPSVNGDKKDDAIPSMQVPPPPGQEKRDRDAIRLARVAAIRDVGKAFARILSWLAVLGIFGAIIYGAVTIWPELLNGVVTPISRNTDDIADLEERVAALEGDFSGIEETNKQVLDEVVTELQAEIDSSLGDASARFAEAEETVAGFGDIIDQLLADVEDLKASDDVEQAVTNLNIQLLIMRAWQETAMARIRLAENNTGLATESLDRAIASMNEAIGMADEDGAALLAPVIERLNLAKTNLAGDPYVAFSDLDASWALLSALITPVEVETPETTPEAGDAAEGTATPDPAATGTVTPGVTATP